MTAGQREHEAAVLHRTARGSRVDIIEAFEHAFTTVWRRSHLKAVTLAAIVERVLQSASEEYPALAATGPGGITVLPHGSFPKQSKPKLRGRTKARR